MCIYTTRLRKLKRQESTNHHEESNRTQRYIATNIHRQTKYQIAHNSTEPGRNICHTNRSCPIKHTHTIYLSFNSKKYIKQKINSP